MEAQTAGLQRGISLEKSRRAHLDSFIDRGKAKGVDVKGCARFGADDGLDGRSDPVPLRIARQIFDGKNGNTLDGAPLDAAAGYREKKERKAESQYYWVIS
jgi:hypothetical protein